MITVGSIKIGTKIGFRNEWGHISDVGEVCWFSAVDFTVQFLFNRATYMYENSLGFEIIQDTLRPQDQFVIEVDCRICKRKNYDNAACCWWCGDDQFFK